MTLKDKVQRAIDTGRIAGVMPSGEFVPNKRHTWISDDGPVWVREPQEGIFVADDEQPAGWAEAMGYQP